MSGIVHSSLSRSCDRTLGGPWQERCHPAEAYLAGRYSSSSKTSVCDSQKPGPVPHCRSMESVWSRYPQDQRRRTEAGGILAKARYSPPHRPSSHCWRPLRAGGTSTHHDVCSFSAFGRSSLVVVVYSYPADQCQSWDSSGVNMPSRWFRRFTSASAIFARLQATIDSRAFPHGYERAKSEALRKNAVENTTFPERNDL